jgi:hypothetical protein
MLNLYSITTNQEAVRALFRVVNRYVGNLPPMPARHRRIGEAYGSIDSKAVSEHTPLAV